MTGAVQVGGPALRRDLLVLGLLAALLFLPGLGRRDLWNPDEARYAQVAREMTEARSWSLPRLNGEVYTQKPPLFFWLIAAAGALGGGIGETTARVPSALAAIGATLLVFLLGHRLFGRRAAWLAAAAFASCFKVLWQGRFGQIDMVLTALVAFAMWWFVRGHTERRPGFYWLFFASAGLATLAKGPAGLLPPLLAVVAYLLLAGERAELRRLRIGRGLLLWAAVVLAWLVPAALAGGREYLDQIVLKQNVTRYADPWHHFRPWYYFLTVVPGDFFPWSLLLPAAFATRGQLGGNSRRGVLFAACWAVVTIVFFSLSPAKRSVYVLTMYPAMALLVGVALDRLAAMWPRRRRFVAVPLAAVLGLAAIAGAAVALVASLPALEAGGPTARSLAARLAAATSRGGFGPDDLALFGGTRFLAAICLAFLLLAVGALAGLRLAAAGRVPRAAAALAAGMAAMWLVVAIVVLPRFDVVKSARGLSAELVARLQPGDVYGIYPRLDSTFLFYSGRFAMALDSPEALHAFAARPEHVWVLAQRDDWQRLEATPPLVEAARDHHALHGYLLFARPETLARDAARAARQPADPGSR